MNQHLLDWLWTQCRCEYLSHLYGVQPGGSLAQVAAKKISEISSAQFSEAEWAEALRYLSADRCRCDAMDSEKLYRRLLSYLSR